MRDSPRQAHLDGSDNFRINSKEESISNAISEQYNFRSWRSTTIFTAEMFRLKYNQEENFKSHHGCGIFFCTIFEKEKKERKVGHEPAARALAKHIPRCRKEQAQQSFWTASDQSLSNLDQMDNRLQFDELIRFGSFLLLPSNSSKWSPILQEPHVEFK